MFSYEGFDSYGRSLVGKIESQNKESAGEQLKKQNIFLMSINEGNEINKTILDHSKKNEEDFKQQEFIKEKSCNRQIDTGSNKAKKTKDHIWIKRLDAEIETLNEIKNILEKLNISIGIEETMSYLLQKSLDRVVQERVNEILKLQQND